MWTSCLITNQIVFVGPFEHHSNLLPWRHLAEKVIRLKTNTDGEVSVDYLEEALKVFNNRIAYSIFEIDGANKCKQNRLPDVGLSVCSLKHYWNSGWYCKNIGLGSSIRRNYFLGLCNCCALCRNWHEPFETVTLYSVLKALFKACKWKPNERRCIFFGP